MSADEWWICKLCNPKESNAKKFLHPEYETIETVRVDYEVWMDTEGNFCFEGSCHCGLCGRDWEIKTKVKPTLSAGEEE